MSVFDRQGLDVGTINCLDFIDTIKGLVDADKVLDAAVQVGIA